MGIRGDTNAFDVLWTATVTDFEGGTVNVAPAYGGTEPTEEQLAEIGEEEYVRLIPAGDGTQAVVMRLNPQKMLGATMTLTASVLVDNRAIDTVTASFTFKFHDIPAVNVYDWYQMRYVVDATVQACEDNAAEEGRFAKRHSRSRRGIDENNRRQFQCHTPQIGNHGQRLFVQHERYRADGRTQRIYDT